MQGESPDRIDEEVGYPVQHWGSDGVGKTVHRRSEEVDLSAGKLKALQVMQVRHTLASLHFHFALQAWVAELARLVWDVAILMLLRSISAMELAG